MPKTERVRRKCERFRRSNALNLKLARRYFRPETGLA